MRSQDRDFPKFEPAVTTFSFLESFVSVNCPVNKATNLTYLRFSSTCMGRFRTCFELSSEVIRASTTFDGLDFLQKLFFKVNLHCSNTAKIFRGSCRYLFQLVGSCLILVDLLFLYYRY